MSVTSQSGIPEQQLEPPSEPVRLPFIVAFAFAQLAIYVALIAPLAVSMAIKVTAIVGAANAPSTAGLILGVGALAALVANPVFGRLSDRTTGRWGRRRPWIVGGAVGLAISLFGVALSADVVTLLLAWFIAQLSANAALAAYLASVADRVPPQQTATVTALSGIM